MDSVTKKTLDSCHASWCGDPALTLDNITVLLLFYQKLRWLEV
jgi:hypothetical protein